MKRRVFGAATCCVLALFSSQAEAQRQTLFRLSYSSGWDALPAIVAIEKGFFARQGLVVSGLPVSPGNEEAVIQSLAAGSTDFATISQRSLLFTAHHNALVDAKTKKGSKVGITVVSTNGHGRQMELVVSARDKKTKSLKDLRRKWIAVIATSEAHPILIRLLNSARMRPTDVRIVRVTAAQALRAFKTRIAVRQGNKRSQIRVSAVFAVRPYTAAMIRRKEARLVINHEGVTKAIGLIGNRPLVVNNRVLKRQTKDVQRFITAWVGALRYIQRNPDDAARTLLIYFHRRSTRTPTLAVVKSWSSMTRYDRYFWSPHDITDAEYTGWALKAGGYFRLVPKLKGYVDNRFGKQALAALEAAKRPAPKRPNTPAKKKAGAKNDGAAKKK